MKQLALSIFVTAFCLPAMSAHAAAPKPIGTFGVWSAYVANEAGGKVCYIAAKPAKSEGKTTKRGEVFLMVTHRPAEKSFDVVSVVAGYAFKDGAEVKVTVDGKKPFTLTASGDTAWTPDSVTDKTLTTLIRAGSMLVMEGASGKGVATKDTFSLKGTTAALKAIDAACGIQR